METKITMTVEQFDNGISIIHDFDEGGQQAIVSLDRSKESDIGHLLCEDIKAAMDGALCNIVDIDITITPKPQDNGI